MQGAQIQRFTCVNPMRSAANNDIALSGERNVFIDQLPKVEEVKADGESLSREVRVALQRGVCTFQVRSRPLKAPPHSQLSQIPAASRTFLRMGSPRCPRS